MDLQTWQTQQKVTDAALAARVSRNQATISRTRRRITLPDLALVSAIVAVTKGEVTPSDLRPDLAAVMAPPAATPVACEAL